MTRPPVTVIVRTKDSGGTLRACVSSIRAQTVQAEVLVVDSGSTDDTLELAAELADRVVHLEAGRFSHGRALNVGAAAAAADVHAAVSSHCELPHQEWLATALENLAGTSVVGTCSGDVDASGQPLRGPLRAAHDELVAHPFWGFTNHAAAWSGAAWRLHPFDEQLPACEDREWSWRATAPGAAVVLDARLQVPVAHRRDAGVRAYSRRLLKEWEAYRTLGRLPPYSVRQAAHDWLGDPSDPAVPRGSRPRGRTRLVEVTARYRAGRRSPVRG